MSTTKNLALIFTKVPTGFPVPGEDLQVKDVGFDLNQDAPPNGLVLEILYSSFDPYLRGKLRDPSIKTYSPAFLLGHPLEVWSLAKVLKSRLDGYSEGDIVRHVLPVQQYVTFTVGEDGAKPRKIDAQQAEGIDIRNYIGALGMPGLTAYSSFYEIGKPKKGETIFVSSAAGAVGQLVGQLAKRDGLKVIGSVGSDQKLKFITETLGFDGGFNYKKETTADALKRLAPDGIDIFYDNVGGEQLAASLDHIVNHGRIVECGQISQYNLPPDQRYPIRNTFNIITKRLTVRGFVVGDDEMRIPWEKPHQENVSRWLKDGTLKAQIHEWQGMDKAADGLVGMLKGESFGKAVLKVKL